MYRRSVKLMVTSMMAAAAMFGADNSVGTWQRNVEKTTYQSANPNPITSLIMVREAVPNGLKVTSIGHRQDGSGINYTFTAKYDGKEYPVTGTGSVFDTIALTLLDANTSKSETRKGKYHMTGLTVISNGGKTMTISNKGADADGKQTSFTVVWNKQ